VGEREESAKQFELLTELGALQGGTFRLWDNPDQFEHHPEKVSGKELEKLMKEGYDAVVYLDPDIQIHSPLDEVWLALESHNAVLTPHLDQPIEDDKYPSEIDILRTGAYNMGFIGLRRSTETMKFIRWWGKRMEQYCVVDLNGGLFVDQKWMDLLPGLLESTFVLRHPGFNVAYWNIHGRQIQKHGDGYRVNGDPLRFFHFSGYHPRQPERFSKHQNRFELSTLPEAARATRDPHSICHPVGSAR
jgi:hypothetical protein